MVDTSTALPPAVGVFHPQGGSRGVVHTPPCAAVEGRWKVGGTSLAPLGFGYRDDAFALF